MFSLLKHIRFYLLAFLFICGTIASINGQGNYLDQLTMNLLETSCTICNKDKKQLTLLANDERQKAAQLFHQLHGMDYETATDSITNISARLKILVDKYYPESDYQQLYYFFYGRQLCKVKLYDEANTAFEKSLQLSSDSLMQGLNAFYLAVTLLEKEQFNESLPFLSKAEIIFKNLGNSNLLKATYSNKATAYLHLERFVESEKTYQQVIEITALNKDSVGLVQSYSNLATLYYEQYLDDKAIPLFKKSLEIALNLGNLPVLMGAHDNMSTVYKNMEDYKNAFEQQSRYLVLKDSLNNIEAVRTLSEQQKQAEKKQLEIEKNKEIALVEKDKQLLTGGILATLFFLSLLIYFYVNSQQQNKIIAAQKQKVDELNTIKDELLSVLGHDLRSPMQHLISVFDRSFRVLKKGNEEKLLKLLQHGHLAVSQTSILLDNVLQWVTQQNKQGYFKKESVALFPLIQQIQGTFLPITQMRAIQLVNEVDTENNILADRNSLKIIIRNLVDNAIKFSPKNGQIRITTSSNGDGRQGIHIQDTGVGISAEVQAKILSTSAATVDASGRKSTGLGLRICKEFIQRHDGELTIESVEGEGSTFNIWLPVE